MIEELNGDFLQWLRGFYHVAQTGSVRKAALLMNRNPSTISYQLRCLEQELNVILFDRYKRSLRITPEGEQLLAWTKTTFETLKGLRSSVSNAGGILKGAVALAATLPVLNYAIPALGKFSQAHPQVRLILERQIAETVRSMVEENLVDFGILPVIKPISGLEILFSARPALIHNRAIFSGIPERPALEDLAGLPFIAFPPAQTPEYLGYFAHDSRLSEVISKNTVITINNNSLMLRLVEQGLGIGIMDEFCLKANLAAEDKCSVSSLLLDHLLPVRLYGILVRPGKKMSPQSLALIRHLRTHFKGQPDTDRGAAFFGANGYLKNGGSDGYGNGCGHKPGNQDDHGRAFPYRPGV